MIVMAMVMVRVIMMEVSIVMMVMVVAMVELLHNALLRCLLMLSCHPKICSLVFSEVVSS